MNQITGCEEKQKLFVSTTQDSTNVKGKRLVGLISLEGIRGYNGPSTREVEVVGEPTGGTVGQSLWGWGQGLVRTKTLSKRRWCGGQQLDSRDTTNTFMTTARG